MPHRLDTRLCLKCVLAGFLLAASALATPLAMAQDDGQSGYDKKNEAAASLYIQDAATLEDAINILSAG